MDDHQVYSFGPLRPGRERDYVAAALLGFASPPPSDATFDAIASTLPEHVRVALDGDLIVGTFGAYDFDLTVPGAHARTAGVTMVTVRPTHRRRGILTDMMRRSLAEYTRDDYPLAALYASESGIYRRFGFGVSSLATHVSVPRHHAALLAEPASGSFRLETPEQARPTIMQLYDRHRLHTLGECSRSEALWNERLRDLPDDRGGAGELRVLIHDGPDGPDGYALYRIKADWSERGPQGVLRIGELIAVDTPTTVAVWNALAAHDLIVELTHHLATDSVILPLLAERRQAREMVSDRLWLRILDVERALGERTYGTDVDLVIELTDEFLPDLSGRYHLTGSPVAAKCFRTSEAPDVSMSADALASIYLGGIGACSLADAGLIDKHTGGAVKRLHLAFATPRAPFCSTMF